VPMNAGAISGIWDHLWRSSWIASRDISAERTSIARNGAIVGLGPGPGTIQSVRLYSDTLSF